MNEKIVFRYNDDLNEFKDLEVDNDVRIRELLDPDFILLFVDSKRYRIWIWHGSNTTTRMKFIAAKLAPGIRDRYGIGYKILAVDEGNETLGFKIMAGLEEEIDYNRKKFILNKDKNGTSVDLPSAERKIKSIMEKESIDEIMIERQYLPEIFKADLLEISKHDGLPDLKPFVISYLEPKGISVDSVGNGIKIKKMKKEKEEDIFVTREYQFLGNKYKVREINRDLKNLRYCSNCDWITKEEVAICEKCGSKLYTMYSSDTKI